MELDEIKRKLDTACTLLEQQSAMVLAHELVLTAITHHLDGKQHVRESLERLCGQLSDRSREVAFEANEPPSVPLHQNQLVQQQVAAWVARMR